MSTKQNHLILLDLLISTFACAEFLNRAYYQIYPTKIEHLAEYIEQSRSIKGSTIGNLFCCQTALLAKAA
jgi:hypothetical protein